MKKILFIINMIFLFSCNSKNDLRIEQLEIENKKLKKIIEKAENNKIINTQLLVLPNNNYFKISGKNRINVVFSEIQEYPDFELYFADEKFNKKEKIKIVTVNKNKIEFDFTPKSKKDNLINIIALKKTKAGNMRLYGTLQLPVQ